MGQGFDIQPKILKGAIVQLRQDGLLPIPIPNIIVFQFNPETISRGKSANTRSTIGSSSSASGNRESGSSLTEEEQNRNQDANLEFQPEDITLTLRLDATDRLSRNQAIAITNGLLPELSALELLMYPTKAAYDLSLGDSSSNGHRTQQQVRDKTLFIWGPFRIIPVNVTSVQIEEQVFDRFLNPIRAQVTVTMRVLEASGVHSDPLLSAAFEYTQGVKEVQALLNIANTVEAVGIEIPFL